MAPRRFSRLTRRQRRLFRLARTVTVTVVLVTGGFWWAGGEEPAEPVLAAGPAASGQAGAAAAAGAPAALDQKAKPRAQPKAAPTPRPKVVPTPRPSPPPAPLARSRPTTVAVPAITIEAPVIELDLDAEGRLATPPVDNPEVVGWYARGVTPGERGTAVVVGHRDTRTGPAIFVSLDSLSPGNTVRVARADGKVAVFTVDRVVTYSKAGFPDKEVYGSTGRPELRLLTCGGAFDPGKGYEANIVVFAHLTDIAQRI
ncbi:class F sortase [Streptomyces sp. NBC_00233]|uniref:class F sortase n=1 Tax=Streptomyces sp. NBC_00233 TaxID=2975686 RepID=UPI0022544BFC|nr:class F sortase [Streptomyces sp. NBC_00233]MCX5225248.1 class F sortase [Streptomyces sp. NBC_00233]